MTITFVGSSKEERNRSRAVAVGYLIDHPSVNQVPVYRRKFNYRKGVDEKVHAGTVYRYDNGKFWWMPWNDRSSGTYINRQGESLDSVWWYQIRKSVGGEEVASEKTLSEARATAIWKLKKTGGKYFYISKGGKYETLGLVSKNKMGGFVWITYKNPRNPVAFAEQYVLYADGRLGKKF